MSRVIFSLTDRQADCLLEIADGRSPPGRDDRHRTRLLGVLVDRGFMSYGWSLTPLGLATVALARELAKGKGEGAT